MHVRTGLIVPLVKDKSGNLSDSNNYRAITIGPVISKVIETVIIKLCEDNLNTDDLQFGFKRNIGCTNAVFLCRSTIDHFTHRGSNIYAATLDIKKAFDKVNHYKLFTSLVKAGLPLCIVTIVVEWYSKLFVSVKWNSQLSYWFPVRSGVRQGSVLSPSLFSVFMNLIIVNIRSHDLGCYFNRTLISCILYADDIILLSASLSVLQNMLHIVNNTAGEMLLEFNANKSYCIAFGNSAYHLPGLCLGTDTLEWCTSVKYLGVNFVSGKHLKFDFDYVRRKFYSACNCIFNNCYGVSELVQLHLQESYCLPVLTYAYSAMNADAVQLKQLNVCWNTVYRKIFRYNRWESVKCCIRGLGRLDLIHLLAWQKLKFYHQLRHNSNTVVLHVFQYLQYDCECDYMQLCATYSCRLFDSLSRLRVRVEGHFDDICVARELA